MQGGARRKTSSTARARHRTLSHMAGRKCVRKEFRALRELKVQSGTTVEERRVMGNTTDYHNLESHQPTEVQDTAACPLSYFCVCWVAFE